MKNQFTIATHRDIEIELKELKKEFNVTSLNSVIRILINSHKKNRKNFAKRNNELEQAMQTIALAVSKLNIKIDKLKND